ncbi:FAD-dependent oxidoreductase [Luteococcus sp. Sow4_B9]|uniref:FAD-dependent oxidoreductase n=1 Tax=Luteococcus sp. Sow4_B9 TaxID=3438792 RepID=UPI003F9716A5
MSTERWIVVGGGATGAHLAHQGAKEGHQVTLLDRDPGLGGLTATETFTVNDQTFEVDRFYHVILESDERVLALLEELDLQDTVRWTSAPAEIIEEGRQYPASSLGQMATLPMLKLTDRVRIGASIAASLALPMKIADRMTAVDWLGRTAGKSALDAFWWPILRAKLGTQADKVSASFMVSTFRRLVQARLKGAGDRFGVLPEGYGPVFAALLERIEKLGGTIRTGADVSRVESDEAGVHVTLATGEELVADRVFITTPAPIASRLLPQLTSVERRRLTDAPYLGVVCGTFVLDHAPNDSYITYLIDDVGLTGVIGMHALMAPDAHGGGKLVYLPHYCASDDEWFDESDDQLRERLLSGLQQCFPQQTFQVLASSINRARHVVPLPLPGADDPLGFTTSIPGVHVVGTAQNTTGTLNVESSLELVDRALAEVRADSSTE